MSDEIFKFCAPGKASVIVGGQWGSEAKGCAAAWVADKLMERGIHFDIVTTNAGAQAGHTSHYMGVQRVVFHLPTVPLIVRAATGCAGAMGLMYLNAGSIIDPDGLRREIEENKIEEGCLRIHPMAAVITEECRDAEMEANSAQTKIGSTRKGVGTALAYKILRKGMVAKDHPYLSRFVRRIDLNSRLSGGKSVLLEVPQGIGLSINGRFYPHCTSRDCTPMAGLSDAGIHPHFYNQTLMVIRTYPIRVGNIPGPENTLLGHSGGGYPGQRETSWEELGVEAEITTVTKRVRRVFEFSGQQMLDAFEVARPDIVFVAFCNYVKDDAYLKRIVQSIENAAQVYRAPLPQIYFQKGPQVDDVWPLTR